MSSASGDKPHAAKASEPQTDQSRDGAGTADKTPQQGILDPKRPITNTSTSFPSSTGRPSTAGNDPKENSSSTTSAGNTRDHASSTSSIRSRRPTGASGKGGVRDIVYWLEKQSDKPTAAIDQAGKKPALTIAQRKASFGTALSEKQHIQEKTVHTNPLPLPARQQSPKPTVEKKKPYGAIGTMSASQDESPGQDSLNANRRVGQGFAIKQQDEAIKDKAQNKTEEAHAQAIDPNQSPKMKSLSISPAHTAASDATSAASAQAKDVAVSVAATGPEHKAIPETSLGPRNFSRPQVQAPELTASKKTATTKNAAVEPLGLEPTAIKLAALKSTASENLTPKHTALETSDISATLNLVAPEIPGLKTAIPEPAAHQAPASKVTAPETTIPKHTSLETSDTSATLKLVTPEIAAPKTAAFDPDALKAPTPKVDAPETAAPEVAALKPTTSSETTAVRQTYYESDTSSGVESDKGEETIIDCRKTTSLPKTEHEKPDVETNKDGNTDHNVRAQLHVSDDEVEESFAQEQKERALPDADAKARLEAKTSASHRSYNIDRGNNPAFPPVDTDTLKWRDERVAKSSTSLAQQKPAVDHKYEQLYSNRTKAAYTDLVPAPLRIASREHIQANERPFLPAVADKSADESTFLEDTTDESASDVTTTPAEAKKEWRSQPVDEVGSGVRVFNAADKRTPEGRIEPNDNNKTPVGRAINRDNSRGLVHGNNVDNTWRFPATPAARRQPPRAEPTSEDPWALRSLVPRMEALDDFFDITPEDRRDFRADLEAQQGKYEAAFAKAAAQPATYGVDEDAKAKEQARRADNQAAGDRIVGSLHAAMACMGITAEGAPEPAPAPAPAPAAASAAATLQEQRREKVKAAVRRGTGGSKGSGGAAAPGPGWI
ncbi:hypothetical protein F5X68DRAFT_253236 [Plectosphaerella plurivora]|uniref:Uncharacterized protein n=1 Tax=Plectosphaerella plurivora TaxID=936078 RepID=A0A9P8VFS1_9PEZI|nr:hypothetical protein F5X68DRAFT_253236 [Plectosphaerella plurivora]